MRRKLLAMDLDGTAVCDDYSMGELSKQAIGQARSEGHVIVFVSGRRDIDMLTLGGDQWSADYHILNTGGKIVRCSDRTVIHNDLIPPVICRKLITHCLETGLQLQICSGMTWQVTRMTEQTMEYAKDVGVIPQIIDSLDMTKWQEGLEGFMATRDWEGVAEYIDRFVPEVYYINSEPGCIDIMASGVSKWKGVRLLAEMLGIFPEDIITVGNYYNDIDMIRHAATGIAVANSLDEVKAEADYVTERDNNHDAVEEIISRMRKGEFDTLCSGRCE